MEIKDNLKWYDLIDDESEDDEVSDDSHKGFWESINDDDDNEDD